MHCEIHKLREVAEKIKEKIPEHYEEACKTNDYEPVEIDWAYFLNADDQNKCFVVTLNEGREIVGYSIFTIDNDPIRKGIIEALNTCLYVMRGFRGVGTKKLLEKSKDFMKTLGADKITYMAKNRALLRMLGGMGFDEKYEARSHAL